MATGRRSRLARQRSNRLQPECGQSDGGVQERCQFRQATESAASGTGLMPRVLSFSEVTDTNWPYLYNGQLQTDAALSSGVVVKERVVLTAAHALFDDSSLEWVTDARWFFQKH